MIFAMARPSEIFRIVPDSIKRTDGDRQWTIPTHRKTDKGLEISFLTLMRLPEQAICPVRFLEELLRRSVENKLPLFHWDNGTPLRSASPFSACLTKLLLEAGIPPHFKPYSIRHATITKLYMTGHDKVAVNTFSGHSQRADTSSRFYLHQMDQWLGFHLATAPPAASPMIPKLVDIKTPQKKVTHSEDEHGDSDSDNNDSDSDNAEIDEHAVAPVAAPGMAPVEAPANAPPDAHAIQPVRLKHRRVLIRLPVRQTRSISPNTEIPISKLPGRASRGKRKPRLAEAE
jgi:hypothetical protein